MKELLNPYYSLDAALLFWTALVVSVLVNRK
jgi:hypothetical protein